MSARDFNRDVSAAKRAAAEGPLVITDRGKPSHVLMTYEAYAQLAGEPRDIVDWLSMEDDDIEFEPAHLHLEVSGEDLSS